MAERTCGRIEYAPRSADYVLTFPDGRRMTRADVEAQGVLAVLQRMSMRLELQRQIAERLICDACGCLCRGDEVCPMCRVRRIEREELRARAIA